MEDIILNPTDLLVKPLTDYFTKNKTFSIDKTLLFDIGIIEHGGKDIPGEWVGKIIYYHTGMSTKVDIKGFGEFDLLPEHAKLLVRLDQNINNY